MKAIVTGAAGFLGAYLARWLRDHSAVSKVSGVVRRDPGELIPGVGYHQRIERADILFHLAGKGGIPESIENPVSAFSGHTELAIKTIDEAHRLGVNTLVLASSCAVYGTHDGPAIEDQTPLKPASPYGVAKLATEAYAEYAYRTRGQDIRIARIGNPYGPGQRRLVIHDLALRAVQKGAPLTFRGTGEEVRDFIHAHDTAKALMTIALNGEPGEAYNVGSGHPVKICKIAAMIAKAAGLGADAIAPAELAQEGKISIAYPDVTRLAALGFKPDVNLEDGISETVEWVRVNQ